MVDVVSQLRELRVGSQVSYHEFLLKLNCASPCLNVFYEGKTDSSFYSALIRRNIPDNINLKTFKCGKKLEVYNALSQLTKKTYKNNTLLFFVDKDIDDIVPIEWQPHDLIHTTTYYSIENYLVNKDVYNLICADLYHLDMGSECLIKLESFFEIANNEFCNWATGIMAWVLCSRRISANPKLANIKLSDLCLIDDDLSFKSKMNAQSLYEYLTEKTKSNVSVLPEYINQTIKELQSIDYQSYIRGKFHSWFLCDFLRATKIVLEKANDGKLIKMHINVNENTIIDIAAPRMKPPRTLIDFITKNLHI